MYKMIFMGKYILLLLLLLFFVFSSNIEAKEKYLEVTCKDGDGVYLLLQKFKLPQDDYYFNRFLELNPKKYSKKNDLFKGLRYKLPIRIKKYNSKSIKSTLGFDATSSKEIQKYNEKLFSLGLIKSDFKISKLLHVPDKYFINITEPDPAPVIKKTEKKVDKKTKIEDSGKKSHSSGISKYKLDSKILGGTIQPVDKVLDNHIFYLSSGHGGPDPGAIGTKDGKELCEDEYAYDVSLRLAKNLIEHGATVYMIVVDPNDGIRDEQCMACDNDEYYAGNDTISIVQNTRLLKRSEIINKLYEKHKKSAKSQTALMIHVDSRYEDKRIDIFFYYKEGHQEGKKIANTLFTTIKEKYQINQPGRGYYGSITSRGLLELRKTIPNSVYIELGNIQNPNDQVRLIDPNNRQAIANWLYSGLFKAVK